MFQSISLVYLFLYASGQYHQLLICRIGIRSFCEANILPPVMLKRTVLTMVYHLVNKVCVYVCVNNGKVNLFLCTKVCLY